MENDTKNSNFFLDYFWYLIAGAILLLLTIIYLLITRFCRKKNKKDKVNDFETQVRGFERINPAYDTSHIPSNRIKPENVYNRLHRIENNPRIENNYVETLSERQEGAIQNTTYDFNTQQNRTFSSVINETYQSQTQNPVYFNPNQEQIISPPGFYSPEQVHNTNRPIYKTNSRIIDDEHIYDVPNV